MSTPHPAFTILTTDVLFLAPNQIVQPTHLLPVPYYFSSQLITQQSNSLLQYGIPKEIHARLELPYDDGSLFDAQVYADQVVTRQQWSLLQVEMPSVSSQSRRNPYSK
jgi:hypothetical protein